MDVVAEIEGRLHLLGVAEVLVEVVLEACFEVAGQVGGEPGGRRGRGIGLLKFLCEGLNFDPDIFAFCI